MWWLLTAPITLLSGLLIYHWIFQYWYKQRTKGDRYFSLTEKERSDFQNTLKRHSLILLPFYHFLAHGIQEKNIATFTHNHIAFPSAITNSAIVNIAEQYQANENDIFVVTFMKSGTTWLQNCVLHLLHHGDVLFDDSHYRHLYAISPWLECSPNASVSMENAPLLSRYKKRIIKSHLPAQLCPFNTRAKYIYLSRSPVDTFSSCFNFFQKMSGPFCPSKQQLIKLFCSDNMLWGNWIRHTQDWQIKADQYNNVLFLRYEDLLDDNINTLKKCAAFLDISLDENEIAAAAKNTAFSAMKAQENYFNMAPPNIFSVNSSRAFLNQNKGDDMDLTDKEKQMITHFCESKNKESTTLDLLQT